MNEESTSYQVVENEENINILKENTLEMDDSMSSVCDSNAASTSGVGEQPKINKPKKRLITIAAIAGIVLVTLVIIIGISLSGSKPFEKMSADELLEIGEKYLLEMNYEQAIIQFLKAIEVEPMKVRAYLDGTDAYLHLDRIPDAVDLLNAGIEATDNKNLQLVLVGVEKSVIEGYIALSEAYEAEGWHEKALELLQRVYDETGDEIIGRKLGIVKASDIIFRDDYIIEWKDPAFENLIRQYLDKQSGDIHYDDVKLIERLEIWGDLIVKENDEHCISWYSQDSFGLQNGNEVSKNGAIQTLDDLEHFSSLSELIVCHQVGLDISALADTENIDCLQRLEDLKLVSNDITDISVVSEMIALKTLNISYNSVKNISPISMLIELTSIAIDGSDELTSIDELRGLRKLESVNISDFASADLSIFLAMPELDSLHLLNIESANYNVLPQLPNLKYLEISCDDMNFQYIKQIETLTNLRLHGHGSWNNGEQIAGLTNIDGIESLNNLVSLDLLAPDCHDITALSSLNIEQIEIDLPDDCDLKPLKDIKTLKKVVVTKNYDELEENSMLEKVRELLPDVELTTD